MNKRGDSATIIIWITLLFALSLGVVVGGYAFNQIADNMLDRTDLSNHSVDAIQHAKDRSYPLLDYFIFFLFVIFFLGIIIASLYIDIHPIFIIFFLIILFVIVLFAGQFSNVFGTVMANPNLNATATNYPLTNMVMNNFPVLVFIVGIVSIIILYGKSRRSTAI